MHVLVMKRLAWLFAALALTAPGLARAAPPSFGGAGATGSFQVAQFNACGYGFCSRKVTVAAPYTGPGDIVSGGAAYHSCTRAWNAAFATGSNNACNLRRASDNTTSNIVILPNGNFDSATANAFAGPDATCNASISGTTLTLQAGACTSALHVNDTLTGAGLTQPVYISAIGTCGSNTSGNTCTLNISQGTVSTEAIAAQVALYITEAYDQTGNGRHATQATAANQIQWLPTCSTGKPCGALLNSAGTYLANGSFPSIAQPQTLAVIGNRTAGGSNPVLFAFFAGAGPELYFGAANQVNIFTNGGGGSKAASDGAWHAFQAVLNATTSTINVDGSTTSNFTTTDATSAMGIGAQASGGSAATGFWAEDTIWPSAVSSGNQGLLHTNYSTYYGTP